MNTPTDSDESGPGASQGWRRTITAPFRAVGRMLGGRNNTATVEET